MTGEFKHIYILDPQAEFLALATPPDNEDGSPGQRDVGLLKKELPMIRELILSTKKYIYVKVYRVEQDLSDFFYEIWALPAFPKLIVFDEVKTYGKTNPFIDYLYRLGGHKDMELIAIAHRFADLPLETRSQTDQYIIFQMTEPRDLKFLKDIVSEEVVEEVKRLRYFQYIKTEL